MRMLRAGHAKDVIPTEHLSGEIRAQNRVQASISNPQNKGHSVRNRTPVASAVPVCLNGLKYFSLRRFGETVMNGLKVALVLALAGCAGAAWGADSDPVASRK